MRRVVSIFLPNWEIGRHRRAAGDAAPPADAPFILIRREGSKRIVHAANLAAQSQDLHPGMPAAKALALIPGLLTDDARPAADSAELDRLAIWLLQRISPIVATDAPDGIVIDSTGADHLHGGEQKMLEGIVARLAISGVTARAVAADTWGAAHAIARCCRASTFVAPIGEGRRLLRPLPLETLRIAPTLASKLRPMGFETIGDLLDQPRAPLTLRFGPELALRIDQALGAIAEPIAPARSPDIIETKRSFAEPIGAAETIAKYISKLVIDLCERLEARGLGARRIDLLCQRVDAHTQAVRIGMAAPVREPKRLTRLLCDKIETIEPGFGIEVMTLAATVAEPIERRQAASDLIQPEASDVSDLIDVLANRVGDKAVYRLAPVASDLPERSVSRVPALAPETGASWPAHWPRPARLLAHPEPVETMALLPDQPPVSFTWRGVRRRVRCADGPERVFGEWWKRDAETVSVRDYFRVEDETGERFWLYRAGDGENAATGSHRWFMHGIFG